MEKKKNEFQAFRALFIAPSNYGKSYLISEFLIDHIKKKHFHPKRVLIFSKTYKTDSSQQMLVQYCQERYKGFKENNCFEYINEDLLEKLYDVQKQIKEQKPEKLKHWVYLMDDMISEGILTDKKSPLVNMFATQRHFNISSVISLQAYRATLSTVVRAQMTIVCIGRLSSQGQVEDILEDYNQGCGINKKECNKKMLDYWSEAIQQRNNHGFLIIFTTKQYGEGRLQCGDFQGPFFDK